MEKNTNINWITTVNGKKEEWIRYKKSFTVKKDVKNAVVRFESDAVCAVFINGEFLISGTGRTPERVNCHQVTSLIHKGENIIEILLGGHYFQNFAFSTREKRGYWLNQAAVEVFIEFSDGSEEKIATDKTWGENAIETMQVTKKEYETMWENAFCWQEERYVKIPDAVLEVAGEEYEKYALNKQEKIINYKNVVETDFEYNDGTFISTKEENYVIVDFGKTIIGYVEIDFEGKNAFVDSIFDVTENLKDFEFQGDWAYTVERLATSDKMESGFFRNYRRRAFRYLKLIFKGNLKINSIKVRVCMCQENVTGWFKCNDSLLNDIWQVGKYTFHLIKQQEYESCPRNEMLFFSGDGVVSALIDNYVFGNCEMLNTSLSLKHEGKAAGISNVECFDRTVWQWDYFAWRIICIYNYYQNYGKKAFLEKYYNEATRNILWLIERMNDKNLLFQIPAFHSTSSSTMIQVDWACSVHRLGENAFLNCLLYKSLCCMSELGDKMNDERSEYWGNLATKVKNAINENLYNEEKQAYMDGLGEAICQDANVLAVLFGVADKDRAQKVLNTIKENLWSECGSAMADRILKNGNLRGGISTVSPMMSTHEAEAWFENGKAEEGLTLIRKVWGSMLEKGATTFWEYNPNNKTDKWEHSVCHGWSAGCTYLLSAYVLGVRPIENWQKIIFAPNPCDLSEFSGVVPTEKGFIAVNFKNNVFTLAVPENIEVIKEIPDGYDLKILKY